MSRRSFSSISFRATRVLPLLLLTSSLVAIAGCPSKDNSSTSPTPSTSSVSLSASDAGAAKPTTSAMPQTPTVAVATPSKPALLKDAKFLSEWHLKKMPVVRPNAPQSVRAINSMADALMVPSLVAIDGAHSHAVIGIEPPNFSHGAREIVLLDWSTHEATSSLMQTLGEPTPDAGAFEAKSPDAVNDLAAFQKALVFAGPGAPSSFVGTISPDTKTILFRAGLNLFRADADGSKIAHFGKAFDGSWPTYSPRGDVVAYIGCAGQVETRVTPEAQPPPGLVPHDPHGGHHDNAPATAICPNTTSFTLHLVDPTKPDDTDRSVASMTAPSPPQFSADGLTVYLASAEKDKNPCVYAVPAGAAGEPKKFACASSPTVQDLVATTAISPSKKIFALITPAQVKGGGHDIVLIDLPAGTTRARGRTNTIDLRRGQFVLTDDGMLIGASLRSANAIELPDGGMSTGSGITMVLPSGTDPLGRPKDKSLHWDEPQALIKALQFADKTHIAFLIQRQDVAELDLLEIPHF